VTTAFQHVPTKLGGLLVLTRQTSGDARGYFSRLFCAQELAALGWADAVAQMNHTHTSNRGTVRGLHFQHPPSAEDKLVTCINGEVFDVAVDLRHNSPTFLQWHAEVLSGNNHRSMLIPKGFAHGFQTLSDRCDLIYAHSSPYRKLAEGGLAPLDPRLSIAWPLPVQHLSDRDAGHPRIDNAFTGL
jgi:dTDP-4-dehydrorhamnose 3,5-epimerase